MKNRIKYVIALILALGVVMSFAGCFTVTVEFPTNENGYVNNGEDEYIQTPDDSFVPDESNAPADVPTEQSNQPADVPEDNPTPVNTPTEAPSVEAPTKAPETEKPTKAPEKTPDETPAASTPDTLKGEALLKYFNNAINTVKSEKAGFTKSKLTTIKDLQLSNSAANTLVGFVKGALLSETEDITNVKKGQSSDDVLSPSGKSYASALTMNDIKNISVRKNGSDYVITVNIKDEVNPTSNGQYSRVMDYMTVDDVEKIYAPKVGATVARKDIKVTLTNSSAKLTVDANGKVKGYETLVNGVLTMKNASIKKVVTIKTDLDITLSSTTKYTNIAF